MEHYLITLGHVYKRLSFIFAHSALHYLTFLYLFFKIRWLVYCAQNCMKPESIFMSMIIIVICQRVDVSILPSLGKIV